MALASSDRHSLIRKFLAHQAQRGTSAHTRTQYLTIVREFCAWGLRRHPLLEAEQRHVRLYLSMLASRDLQPGTIEHHVSVLRQFFHYLQQEAGMQRNPLDAAELPERLPARPSKAERGTPVLGASTARRRY
jgi:site-specific recombinase XerD